MMSIEKIKKVLEELEISYYQVCERITESAEMFFVKRNLDMRRMKHVQIYEVIIYHDFQKEEKKMRGSAQVHIFPEMKEEDIKKVISEAYVAASFVENPYYELPKGETRELIGMPSRMQQLSLEESANAFANALFEYDVDPDAFVNSAEIFVNRHQIHIWNSEGISVGYLQYEANGEFVVQCIKPQDVELYQDFSYYDLCTDNLKVQVKEALEAVRARAKAVSAPAKGIYDVILSGKQMRELLQFYVERSNTALIYPGYSNYKVGMDVQGEGQIKEALNITLKAIEPYSQEGISMMDRKLLKDGKLCLLHGGNRLAHYMDIEPTGEYRAILVENGTNSLEEMKQEPYLHIVRFSDFSMDSFTGYFGGEIRLAYYYDGKTVTPVTGGSINGNLLEAQKELIFSKERYTDSSYDGPTAVKIPSIFVAGE